MDPIAFRLKNFMRDGDVSPIGHVVPHIKCADTVDEALRASRYSRARKKFTGRGLAVAQWLPLGGEASAFVTIDGQGHVTVAAAMVDQGAGTYTAMRLIAANELQVPVEAVGCEILDTGRVGPDTGVGASRATRIFGGATQIAAANCREKLLEAAANQLGVARDGVALAGTGYVRALDGKRLSFGEIARAMGATIRGSGHFKNFTEGPHAALCVQVAEVEVDGATGHVKLTGFTTVHSTGTVINPLTHQGQIDGGVVMGLGYSLMEQLVIDGGKVGTTNFGENKIPSTRDIPPLKTVVQEYPVGNGPYGGMSIGEPPVLPAAAAIANAVHDAVGVRIYDLPITAEKVFAAMKGKHGTCG
jgi:CO/xanthine dehydrogenase Mo-binding subunit